MFHKVSGNDNFFCLKKEKYDFLSRTCCFRVPKKFKVEPFSVSLNSGIENFLHKRIRSRSSVLSKFFASEY